MRFQSDQVIPVNQAISIETDDDAVGVSSKDEPRDGGIHAQLAREPYSCVAGTEVWIAQDMQAESRLVVSPTPVAQRADGVGVTSSNSVIVRQRSIDYHEDLDGARRALAGEQARQRGEQIGLVMAGDHDHDA